MKSEDTAVLYDILKRTGSTSTVCRQTQRDMTELTGLSFLQVPVSQHRQMLRDATNSSCQ